MGTLRAVLKKNEASIIRVSPFNICPLLRMHVRDVRLSGPFHSRWCIVKNLCAVARLAFIFEAT